MSLRPEERRLEYLARLRTGGGGGSSSSSGIKTYWVLNTDVTLTQGGNAFVFNTGMSNDRSATLWSAPGDGDQIVFAEDSGSHHWHLIAAGSGITINGGADFFCANGSVSTVTYVLSTKNWIVLQYAPL